MLKRSTTYAYDLEFLRALGVVNDEEGSIERTD